MSELRVFSILDDEFEISNSTLLYDSKFNTPVSLKRLARKRERFVEETLCRASYDLLPTLKAIVEKIWLDLVIYQSETDDVQC